MNDDKIKAENNTPSHNNRRRRKKGKGAGTRPAAVADTAAQQSSGIKRDTQESRGNNRQKAPAQTAKPQNVKPQIVNPQSAKPQSAKPQSATAEAGGAGKAAKNSRYGKNGKSGKNTGARSGGRAPMRVHDGYDDIKSCGGRYVQTPDYNDDYDISSVLTVLKAQEEKNERIRGTQTDGEEEDTGAVAGRNAVRELLKSGRSVDKIFVRGGTREGSITVLTAEASRLGIPVLEASAEKLDMLSGGINHQGIVAMAAQKQYTDIDGILEIAHERGEIPLVVIADGVEDTRNLGALIRCAECAGAHGLIIPKRRSAPLSPATAKASAGAIEHMAIARVPNLISAIEALKKKGLWIFAAEAGGTAYYEADFTVPAAVIFGSEGAGIGRALKEKSDFLISIPMYGKVNSLNVSTAASVILCHAARMQHTK